MTRGGVSWRSALLLLLGLVLVSIAPAPASAFLPPLVGTTGGGRRETTRRTTEPNAAVDRVVAPSASAAKCGARRTSRSSAAPLRMSTVPDFQKSYVLTDEEVNPIMTFKIGGKEKVVNLFGLWTFVVSLVTGPIWAAAMYIVNAIDNWNDDLDPNRAIYDKTGKVWSKFWLTMTMSLPTLSGDVDRLKEGHGACLYVANHASWLDIPVLCTVLDPVFKFIAKGELRKVPCIGQQLAGGKHILIDREDRKSQFLTFKEGLTWLKKGVPLMAFPEGKRSDDGRLIDFKGGIFSMAIKSKVPIVPLSVSNTHAVMPGNSLFPVQPGVGKLHIHVHTAINTEGLSENEIAAAVREALLSKMPQDQQPLLAEEEEIVDLHDMPSSAQQEILKQGGGGKQIAAAVEEKQTQESL